MVNEREERRTTSGIFTRDPAVMLDFMLLAGEDLESTAAALMAQFGPGPAADAMALMAMTYPVEGIRGLAHLAGMGVPLTRIVDRMEALNFSPWSLVASERVSAQERLAIAQRLGGFLADSVSEQGLRIVDRHIPYLDDGLVVDGSLLLYRVTGMTATPDRLHVSKIFDIWDCPDLRVVGTETHVQGLMRVRDCNITIWPCEAQIAELDRPGEPIAPYVKAIVRRRRSTAIAQAPTSDQKCV